MSKTLKRYIYLNNAESVLNDLHACFSVYSTAPDNHSIPGDICVAAIEIEIPSDAELRQAALARIDDAEKDTRAYFEKDMQEFEERKQKLLALAAPVTEEA